MRIQLTLTSADDCHGVTCANINVVNKTLEWDKNTVWTPEVPELQTQGGAIHRRLDLFFELFEHCHFLQVTLMKGLQRVPKSAGTEKPQLLVRPRFSVCRSPFSFGPACRYTVGGNRKFFEMDGISRLANPYTPAGRRHTSC